MPMLHRTVTTDDSGESRVFISGINRGMVFWVDLGPTETKGSEQYHDDARPWLVISIDSVHQKLPIVQAVPLSHQLHKEQRFRVARVRIPASEFIAFEKAEPYKPLAGDSLALTEQVRVLAHERLLNDPVAKVSKTAILSVEAGVRYVLGIK